MAFAAGLRCCLWPSSLPDRVVIIFYLLNFYMALHTSVPGGPRVILAPSSLIQNLL
jgi:hypothetical protein